MDKRAKYRATFSKFVPEAFADIPAELLLNSKVHFKIVKGRKTKQGDFRPKNAQGKAQITVNGDLNPYAFLITTLHEFAHLHTFEQFGLRVLPHGPEWKMNFHKLMARISDHSELPESIRKALSKSYGSIKASSCTDISLSRVLATFDKDVHGLELLENLPKSCKFALSNKIFTKGNKRRTRFECTDLSSNRMYLVHLMAKVKRIEDEE